MNQGFALSEFKVGLVFQYPEYQLFEETCYKDIAFGPKNMGIKEDQIDKYVKEAARMVGLSPEILDKSPFWSFRADRKGVWL